MNIIVNEQQLAKLAAELGIENDIFIEIIDADTPGIQANLLGDANRTNHIRLVVGHADQYASRLTFVHSKIVATLLHEIKHLEQFQKWTREEWERDKLYAYGVSPAERECNEFAATNVQKWRSIISIKRPVRSRLSKLSAAEQNVRNSR